MLDLNPQLHVARTSNLTLLLQTVWVCHNSAKGTASTVFCLQFAQECEMFTMHVERPTLLRVIRYFKVRVVSSLQNFACQLNTTFTFSVLMFTTIVTDQAGQTSFFRNYGFVSRLSGQDISRFSLVPIGTYRGDTPSSILGPPPSKPVPIHNLWVNPLCLLEQSASIKNATVQDKIRHHPFEPTITYLRVFPLCLINHHATKSHRGVEVQLHAFLTSASDGGKWSASRSGRFTFG